MNNRIKQLAFQAMSINQKVSDDSFFVEVSKLNEFEKFAELLVGECMEQVWYTREDGINGNVSEVIKDRIKQHFGVGE